MANAKIITYECDQCGSEIVVTTTGKGYLNPIYCCGIEVTEVSSAVKKPAKPKKKTAKKPAKKVVKKKTAPKKKPVAKKKAAKR